MLRTPRSGNQVDCAQNTSKKIVLKEIQELNWCQMQTTKDIETRCCMYWLSSLTWRNDPPYRPSQPAINPPCRWTASMLQVWTSFPIWAMYSDQITHCALQQVMFAGLLHLGKPSQNASVQLYTFAIPSCPKLPIPFVRKFSGLINFIVFVVQKDP